VSGTGCLYEPPDVLPVAQPVTTELWLAHDAVNPTSGLALSVLYSSPDCSRKRTAALMPTFQIQHHVFHVRCRRLSTVCSELYYLVLSTCASVPLVVWQHWHFTSRRTHSTNT